MWDGNIHTDLGNSALSCSFRITPSDHEEVNISQSHQEVFSGGRLAIRTAPFRFFEVNGDGGGYTALWPPGVVLQEDVVAL